MTAAELALVKATQHGLPLVPRPYQALADDLGVDEAQVISLLRAMLADGRIRRIGAVPNHYAIGYSANAMSVWDVTDEAVDSLGPRVGALAFVTHCYRTGPTTCSPWSTAAAGTRPRARSRSSAPAWDAGCGEATCSTARASSRRPG
jgi:hypothetical protein